LPSPFNSLFSFNCVVPVPRGAHSATLIGSQMYVFGGYGGVGFARRDFNDINVLDLDTWEWRLVECTGEIPDPRSGHQGMVVKENLFVIGGWNSMVSIHSIKQKCLFHNNYLLML